jgi:hypothetical protein
VTEKQKSPPKCGLIMPISQIDGCSESHWEEVRTIIKEALADEDFIVELVSNSNEIGIIQKRIVQNIHDNEMIICDVSARNSNVMFELGMRLAFDKPTIIIKDDKTNYSFDTSPIEHLEYPRDLHYHTIQAFKIKLREKVIATYKASKTEGYTTFLKHFGQFVVANIDEKKVGKEEYLLEVIGDLRDEVRGLSRAVHLREPRRPLDLASGLGLADVMTSRRNEDWFVQEYLKENKNVSIIELIKTDSPAFNNLLENYLEKHVPENIAMKDRHRQMIKRSLHEAIQREAVNRF